MGKKELQCPDLMTAVDQAMIYLAQLEASLHERAAVCGCPNCQAHADGVTAWLNSVVHNEAPRVPGTELALREGNSDSYA